MNQGAQHGPVKLVDRLTRTGLGSLATSDPGILKLAERELARQRSHLNLVAASSPTSPEVLAAQGLGLSALTAEGYPGRRYHPGTEVIGSTPTAPSTSTGSGNRRSPYARPC